MQKWCAPARPCRLKFAQKAQGTVRVWWTERCGGSPTGAWRPCSNRGNRAPFEGVSSLGRRRARTLHSKLPMPRSRDSRRRLLPGNHRSIPVKPDGHRLPGRSRLVASRAPSSPANLHRNAGDAHRRRAHDIILRIPRRASATLVTAAEPAPAVAPRACGRHGPINAERPGMAGAFCSRLHSSSTSSIVQSARPSRGSPAVGFSTADGRRCGIRAASACSPAAGCARPAG